MKKRDELSNRNSCLNKADDMEFVFVLRSKDPTAPQTIRHWASMNKGIQPESKIEDALKCAEEMENYRKQYFEDDKAEEKV